MVVVHQRGSIPITYSANWCSCATFVTVIFYLAAIIFPYLIAGWTKNFFPLTDERFERPYTYTDSSIVINITGTTKLEFSLPKIDPPVFGTYAVPLYERSSRTDEHEIKFSLTFPKDTANHITGYSMEFPIYVKFTNVVDSVFTGKANVFLDGTMPLCSADIYGSLGFSQQKPYSPSGLRIPNPPGYQEYAENNDIPSTDSDTRLYGNPYFDHRTTHYIKGDCSYFRITFNMRVPMTKIFVEKNIWYSFLGGWSTYIALAIPCFYIIFAFLEFLFGSGIIPVMSHVDAQLNTEGAAKFNR